MVRGPAELPNPYSVYLSLDLILLDQVDHREMEHKTSRGLTANSGPNVDHDTDRTDHTATLEKL